MRPGFLIFACSFFCAYAIAVPCQQNNKLSGGVSIVQPGAPGHPSKILPQGSAGIARQPSPADIEFMQGMIVHHAQAVEMTELLRARSHNKELLELGERISISQKDEMNFMKRWLEDRDLPLSSPSDDMAGVDMSSMALMPGMLTPQQMKALAAAKGPSFDHLFLTGMIQHHTGALTMVKDLFASAPDAGQDPQLFDFASDVDNTQQAEIDIMQHMLQQEKR